MTDSNAFIESFLAHDYDPIKAHEYYMRTRELKGRKPGSPPVHPGSKVQYSGKPLQPLGTRMEEDASPNVSPTGAKLTAYSGTGLGRAEYADGHVYDARTGWSRNTTPPVRKGKAQLEDKRQQLQSENHMMANRQKAIEQMVYRTIDAQNATDKIADPKKREAARQKLEALQRRLSDEVKTLDKKMRARGMAGYNGQT